MEMREARRNDVWVLALKGRLDAVSTPCVRNRLQERIDQGERRFAVDAAGSPTSVAPAWPFRCRSESSSKSVPDGWCCVLSTSP